MARRLEAFILLDHVLWKRHRAGRLARKHIERPDACGEHATLAVDKAALFEFLSQVVGAAPSQLPPSKHVRVASPLGTSPAEVQEYVATLPIAWSSLYSMVMPSTADSWAQPAGCAVSHWSPEYPSSQEQAPDAHVPWSPQ